MSAPAAQRREDRLLLGIFVAALAVHLWAVTYHWKIPYMAGHEFRQAQTAITSYYIDRDNNFGLLYETPILGKPWVSILMEVPLYEWTVVLASRATGLPHFEVARGVSTACFYLMLPALALLLARLGLARPRRWFALALVLTCPVYIYYTRAFLMDSMVLMFSAWWLLGFVRTMDAADVRITNMRGKSGPEDNVRNTNMSAGRRAAWLALTIVAGTAAALVKSAIFAVWLWPAVGYGAWLLGRDLRAHAWDAALRTTLWGIATVVVALGALRAWVLYTDPLKAAHDSAWIFTSKNLTQGNWGLFHVKPLFSRDVWGFLLGCWDQAVMSRWLIAVFGVAALALPGARRAMLGIGSVFFLAQAMFPYAYAYQDYYFYSCALFLVIAFAYVGFALLDSRWPRWVVYVLLFVPFVAQLDAYRRGYWVTVRDYTQAGYPFTEALRELTPAGSVLVGAGLDWAAMVPLYAERRALLVRKGLEHDPVYLEKAFGRLADEDVSAVVVCYEVRTNRQFLERAARHFDFDPARPAFSWNFADVYVPRRYRRGMQLRIETSRRYPSLVLPRAVDAGLRRQGRLELSADVAREVFPNVSPAPEVVEFEHGWDWLEHGTRAVLYAHPDSNLWLRPAMGSTRIRWKLGMVEKAYANPAAATNGVEFLIDGERPDGSTRRLYRRVLEPATRAADRGEQEETIPYVPQPGELLHFATRPNGNPAFDWAYWTEIEVR